MDDARAGILADLEAALEDVLAALGSDGAVARPGPLDAARVRAEDAFLRLRAADAAMGASARPYPADLREQLAAVMRLQALAQSQAGGARVGLADARARITAVRGALRQHAREAPRAEPGRSCDVRG